MRNLAVAAGGVLASGALGFVTTATTAVALAAATGATALIMGGTGNPLATPPDTLPFVDQYTRIAIDNYISPASVIIPASGIPQGPYSRVAVITPEEFAPNTGSLTFDQSVAEGLANLDNCVNARNDCDYNSGFDAPTGSAASVVFGFSQSSTIATLEKRDLADRYATGEGPDVSFVLTANGNRPNGGFLARGPEGVTIPWPFTFHGATFTGPTPTDTQYATVDVSRQYDGWSDYPVNPLNLLAVLNAMKGIDYLHVDPPGYAAVSLDDPSIIDQGRYGDTTYYLAPTPILPLLMPLVRIPVIGYALADALDAPLRVLVEAGYNRSVSPGQPTSWDVLYLGRPLKTAISFILAIPVGIDNGMQDLFGVRPFHTQRPGPFGVGSEGWLPATSAAGGSAATATADTRPTGPASAAQRAAARADTRTADTMSADTTSADTTSGGTTSADTKPAASGPSGTVTAGTRVAVPAVAAPRRLATRAGAPPAASITSNDPRPRSGKAIGAAGAERDAGKAGSVPAARVSARATSLR